MAKKAKRKYSPHPALGKEAADKDRLREATGKSFDEWVALAKRKGPKGQRECRQWLQQEHGHGSRNAWWLASVALAPQDEPDYTDPEGLVAALYSGPKAALRPLHEKVVDLALACGDDVVATSCKTMVPLYRKHVFAELKPTAQGVEVQLAIGDAPAKDRLQPSRGRQPDDRLTHRVVLKSDADVDAEFKGWLAQAYENGAGKLKRSGPVSTPEDLGRALAASAKATATWESSTDSMRREWVMWIESAKQAETRERRIATTIEKLASGKKKAY